MENYVKSIKEEVKTENNIDSDLPSNYRELLLKFIVSSPVIKIEKIDGGDVSFSIGIKEIGLSCRDVEKYRTEIYSYLAVNFMGELMVRENINVFAKILTKIDKNVYSDVVNSYEHRKFGLKMFRSRLHFYFHISLVQTILNEDFRREVKKMEKN